MKSSLVSQLLSRSRRLPLRFVLVAPFMLLTIGAVTLVGYLSCRSSQQAVEETAYQLLQEVSDRVKQDVEARLHMLEQLTTLNAGALQEGTLNWRDFPSMERQFAQEFIAFPNISGLSIATEGREFLVVEHLEQSTPTVRVFDRSTNYQLHRYSTDTQGQRKQLLDIRTNYNPHQDPPGNSWYGATKVLQAPIWRIAVSLALGQDRPQLVVINFVPFYDSNDQFQGVTGASISLTRIGDFLASLKISNQGQVFILDRQGLLIATSTGEVPFQTAKSASHAANVDPQKRRLSAVQSVDFVTAQTAKSIVAEWQDLDQITEAQQRTWKLADDRYFVQVEPLQQQLGWLVVTVVPETDFTTALQRNIQTTLMICTGTLLGAIGLGIGLARRVTKPIAEISAAAQQVAIGQLDTLLNSQRIDELGELSRSFDQMVLQLRNSFTQMQSLNQALGESEHRLNQILETLPIGVSLHRADGSIAYLNSAAKQLLGNVATEPAQTAETLAAAYQLYRSGSQHQYPTEELPVVRALRGETVSVEDIEIRRQTEIIPLEVNASPVRGQDGIVIAAVTAFRDIAERRKAERILSDYNRELEAKIADRTTALQESEERNRAILAAIPDLLHLVSSEGIYLAAIKSDSQFSLISEPQKFIGKHLTELVSPEIARAKLEAISQALATGEVQTYEQQISIADEVRCKEVRVVPCGEDALVMIRDMTDRKIIEAELQAQRRFLHNLVDIIPCSIFVKDREGRFLLANQAAAAIYGKPIDEMLGRTSEDLQINQDQAQIWHSNNLEVMTTRQPKVIPAQPVRNHLGEKRWHKTIITPYIDPAGEVQGVIGVGLDITDLKTIAEELRIAKETAESANDAKSIFLANMSHELRTPLNAILGYTQLMVREFQPADPRQEQLKVINRNGEYLLQLINDILSISKIEAGQATLDESNFDLYLLLNGLEAMFCRRAEAKMLAFICDWTAELPQYIRTDERKLKQIITNLVDNALKFTHRGSVTLRVGIQSTDPASNSAETTAQFTQSGCTLYFEVADTGIGIAPQELDTIFEAFVQSEAGKQSQQGTGLGLPICRRFVQLMGGEMSAASELRRGSTFRFTLPVQRVSSNAVPMRSSQRVTRLAPGQPVYRMLVVDDTATNRQLMTRWLTDRGFEVREAANGQEAIDRWRKFSPHLIWMDMRMPVMDGFTAVQQIRKQEQRHLMRLRQPTVIIAITAALFEEERQSVLAIGCNDFVSKPCSESIVFDKIAQHLNVRYLYDEPSPAQHDSTSQHNPTDRAIVAALQQRSVEWLAQLEFAARSANETAIFALLDELPADANSLRQTVTQLVQNFQLQHLIQLIQSCR